MSSLCDMALETSDDQTLLVTGLPTDFTAEYGKRIFGQYAKVKKMTTFTMPSGTPEDTAAFLTVRTEDAKWVLEHVDGNIPNHLQQPVTVVMVPAGSGCDITGPSQIQALTWPLALQRKDVIGIAATGSGKTLAFLLPAFCNMLKTGHDACVNGPGLLVLCPTRELAQQTEAQAELFIGFKAVAMYETGPRRNQLEKYKNGVHTVVACPRRLLEFVGGKRPQVKLDGVSCLVLDEADRMLDMGFGQEIRKILLRMPKRQHTMLFTATWPMEVQLLAAQTLKPNKVMIGNCDEPKANKEHEMEEADEWGPWCAGGNKELGIMGPGRNPEEVEGPPDLAPVGAELRSDVTNVEVIADEVLLTEGKPEEDGLAVHALPEQADSPTFEEVQQVDGSVSDPIDEETLPGSDSSGILPSQSKPEEVDGLASAPVIVEGGDGSMALSELEEEGSAPETAHRADGGPSEAVPNVVASDNDAEAEESTASVSTTAPFRSGMMTDIVFSESDLQEVDERAQSAKPNEEAIQPGRKRLRSKTPASAWDHRPPADVAPKRYRLRGKTPAMAVMQSPQASEAKNGKKRSLSPGDSTHATMVSSKCVKVDHSRDRTPRSPAPRSLPSMRGTISPASSLLPCSAPSTPQRRSKPTSKVPAGHKVKSPTSKCSPRSKHKETLRSRERR